MPRKKTDKLTPVGKRIKKVRTDKKITPDMLANETGFSTEHIREIESGKRTPSVGTLLTLSRALGIDSGSLLKEPVENGVEFRIQSYTKRTENYAYTTLTPGAENKHLKAFLVEIEPLAEHTGVEYQHEGEEFSYILTGAVEIVVGDHVNTLRPGDTLHFNSGIKHKIRNISEETTKMLVVIYQP
jgi:quercetin dioxygenase-like cupin family protein